MDLRTQIFLARSWVAELEGLLLLEESGLGPPLQEEGNIMALSLGGVTPAEIKAGLEAVDTLVELVEKLPFVSSNGTVKTALTDLDTGLKWAETAAGDL